MNIKEKLADLSDFWNTHTAPMAQVELGSIAPPDVAAIDPKRVRFYLQVINRLPKFKQILKEYNLGSNVRNAWYTAIRDINSKGKYVSSLPDYRQRRLKKEINAKLKQNPLTTDIAFDQNNKGPLVLDPQTSKEKLNIERAKEQLFRDEAFSTNTKSMNNLLTNTNSTLTRTTDELRKLQNTIADNKNIRENINQLKTTGGSGPTTLLTNTQVETQTDTAAESPPATVGNFFSDKLGDLKKINAKIKSPAYDKAFSSLNSVKNLENTDSQNFEEVLREKDKIINSINEHPIYGQKEQKTTTVDITIFCALTYIIRGISLYLLDWAFSTNMISTLAEGFFFYVVVYWIIFGLICIIVNTDIDKNNGGFANPFKAIFYYLNMDVNPSMRIVVHLIIQFILFPIILFISDGSINPDQDSYQKKRSIVAIINNLTLLIWFLTSIIAFRI